MVLADELVLVADALLGVGQVVQTGKGSAWVFLWGFQLSQYQSLFYVKAGIVLSLQAEPVDYVEEPADVDFVGQFHADVSFAEAGLPDNGFAAAFLVDVYSVDAGSAEACWVGGGFEACWVGGGFEACRVGGGFEACQDDEGFAEAGLADEKFFDAGLADVVIAASA